MAKVCSRADCPDLVQRAGASQCPTHDPGPWGGPGRDERRTRTTSPHHRRNRETVRKRDSERCYICGIVCPDGQADHLTPIAEGGADDTSNMGWICRPHHATKSAGEGGRASANAERGLR